MTDLLDAAPKKAAGVAIQKHLEHGWMTYHVIRCNWFGMNDDVILATVVARF